jgi:hypothetical protein
VLCRTHPSKPYMTESTAASPEKVADRRPRGRVHIGERLRRHVEELVANYVRHMRADPALPKAKKLPAPLLEDHALSFLGDLFQTLVILEEKEELDRGDESELLSDGTKIQGLISELHGRQRHGLGWTEKALDREYEILRDEVEAIVRKYGTDTEGTGGVAWAVDVCNRLLGFARNASFKGFGLAKATSSE